MYYLSLFAEILSTEIITHQQKLVDYTPSPICYVTITLEIEMLNCCVLSSHILLLTATDGSVS